MKGMIIGAYSWYCPVCGRQGAMIGGAKPSKVDWATRGGGTAVCTDCARDRKDEIDKHNEIYLGNTLKKKDINCKHEWVHPYPARWYCIKCGATFNWMCGCGGSAYVCDKHYNEFIKRMIEESGSIENYLANHSW